MSIAAPVSLFYAERVDFNYFSSRCQKNGSLGLSIQVIGRPPKNRGPITHFQGGNQATSAKKTSLKNRPILHPTIDICPTMSSMASSASSGASTAPPNMQTRTIDVNNGVCNAEHFFSGIRIGCLFFLLYASVWRRPWVTIEQRSQQKCIQMYGGEEGYQAIS